ncbi:3-dehydroquinate synthase [Chitinimonas sp. BJB300]|uniref:3-dehydroquinate synthase n=1 Tax=Chitinimonas sp. BJB300 TaxID=1559339 RepID=UPI000C0F46B0|nr:3-dehydroquinate synthase [Chitinimonas sp. BJB300]PHV11988.1 3-dehydroquinate synthase [Chitinimonas sp. BJB300]TSJ91431.1 3-dehydroquinate synthase [Chitinimonas sp. BJB300]
MFTVPVELDHAPYQILIARGLLKDATPFLEILPQPRVAIVTNTTVAALYLEDFQKVLDSAGVEALPIVLPDGEQYKTWETLNLILDALLEHRCERRTTLIALGGGVIGDMTGFAAAIYQRGMPFIQVPTTLLAQVDSSVGGKTAINHPLGKNMIGAFYQPRLVLADLDTLITLPAREYSAGLAEVIKYGLIDDLPFLEWLETNMAALMRRDLDAVAYAVERSCRNKARIVAADEREEGIRALLNLGHTFGHAIEAGLGYGKWLHGEAIAAGMVLAATSSNHLGWLDVADVARVKAVLTQANLPVDAPALGYERWMALMAQDKKVLDGKIRFVLMRRLGQSELGYLTASQLLSILP